MKCHCLGDYDGSDNELDDDENNVYGTSEAKGFGPEHWQRPDVSNIKEEKVRMNN